MDPLLFEENGIHMAVAVGNFPASLLHCSLHPFDAADVRPASLPMYRLTEMQAVGENHADHAGMKHTGGLPGNRLVYRRHDDERTANGREISLYLEDPLQPGFSVVQHYSFPCAAPVVRAWVTIENGSPSPVTLEHVSSFYLAGIAKDGIDRLDTSVKIATASNTWHGELQWQIRSLPECGKHCINGNSMKSVRVYSTGSWSCCDYLPMGACILEETGISYVWQIENNGSWYWELSDVGDHDLFFQLSGPTGTESHWTRTLLPGEGFVTVPVAVAIVAGGLDTGLQALNSYRRAIRRSNRDNVELPVIFNDYMNCLMGDPTEEKLLPLIEAASAAGCEYFVVDAGWYTDGSWLEGMGEWIPSIRRFPNGIDSIFARIAAKGMVPGIWLEIEVVYRNSPAAATMPDDWFFQRDGSRVLANGRYQLDFSNPDVLRHADAILKRLVVYYGVGYIKMDYNHNIGPGTDRGGFSLGDGLLRHGRAYLTWIESVLDRYPDLVIENCGSGGLRMDGAMLRLHSIQSSSDQTDYRKTAVIAAASPSAIPPEQCGVWSYPLSDGDDEETIFNMVNAMLARFHQSGHLAAISAQRFALVREGIACYKKIRKVLPESTPSWPLGLPTFESEWAALVQSNGPDSLLSIWRLGARDRTIRIPFPQFRGVDIDVQCLYPSERRVRYRWHPTSGILAVEMPADAYSARMLRLSDRTPSGDDHAEP